MLSEKDLAHLLEATKSGTDVLLRDADGGHRKVLGYQADYKPAADASPQAVMLLAGDRHIATDGVVLGDFVFANPIREIRYNNPPTVVVVLVPIGAAGLLLIRRALKDGYGKLALPGGFQVKGETWQEAGAREVLEETGIELDPGKLSVAEVISVERGSINLLFANYANSKELQVNVVHDGESLEISAATQEPAPAEIAFDTHAEMIRRWFARNRKQAG